MKALTIFTPSYNRAHLLPRIYTCLKDQTCQDFIWLIVDDGSVDDTRQVVAAFIQEDTIEIQYIAQENQGMHGAHNTAYENIITPLNTCIDSDDYLPTDAVEKILRKWETVEHKEKYSGLVGLDADLKGNLIGSPFRTETTTLEDFYLQGGTGDKKLVYRTAVMQQYPPYPLFPGEKYVGLGYKYQLADQDFELVTLNEILVLVDYQPGGSSNNMFRQYYNNPRGFAFIRKQGMVLSKSPVKRFKDAVHYVSSSLLSGNRKFIAESPRKAMTVLAFPLGLVLYAIVLFKNRKVINSNEL
ncbi:glycosyltransferase family 2 protein [Chryseobacterium salivictor]|uniref:GalNAc(5)-diNAcBac-PP-undecaprenol beta-1,3-glucosyltransferase n=1 Tax=Chryseobacterium salivictor TaxID=2547600 RepID=A0A4P6ZFS1_9FLAO|nr:glycosyltransferase family 2 protein [Chryseobacterium salivictor]QBO58369.1 GalNAc(5)-diNAcBac-PP-undecaprenol beta-1,3-glucosyltransferase [Chryseobacterium salivictor]